MDRDSQTAGQELLDKAEAYERQHKVSFSEAMRAVAAANPALARTWNGYSPSRVVGDPGQVLADEIDQMVQRERINFSEATRRVMAAADPALVKAYHAGEPYRGGSLAGQPVHYSQLSEAEKRQHAPWLRQLQPGEPVRDDRTYLMKLGIGGGRYEVLE